MLTIAAMLLVGLHAQCGEWLYGPGEGSDGVRGSVNAMIAWDPDGPGPLGESLVLAGHFRVAGDADSRCLAAWDGERWIPMGLPRGADGNAQALAVWNGDLYVGGEFSSSNWSITSNLMRWDGARWQGVTPGPQGVIEALIPFRGELIVAGAFSAMGSVAASNIASWDGTRWHALGAGLDARVRCLEEFQGSLIAGGEFQRAGALPASAIAAWDGSAWSAPGSVFPFAGLSPKVRALRAHDARLWMGGEFAGVDGLEASGLAVWNGVAWSAPPGASADATFAFARWRGELYAARFTGIERFDGAGMSRWVDGRNPVAAMLPFRDDLVVAGSFISFTAAPQSLAASSIVRTSGTSWTPLSGGTNAGIVAAQRFGDAVYAGGYFTSIGGVPAPWLARWDGRAWQPVPGAPNGPVTGLALGDAGLIAAGKFSEVGGRPAGGLGIWDGAQWSTLGLGPGPGVNAAVQVGSRLFVVQSSTSDQGEGLFSIFEWDGSAWSATTQPESGFVWDAVPDGSSLVIAGRFASVGGVAARNIASWDGSAWSPLGPGLPTILNRGGAYSLVHYRGLLVAGYDNWTSVAGWDGEAWNPMPGPGTGPTTLFVHQGRLYAGGAFHLINPAQIADGLAVYDGAQWRPMGLGLGSAGLLWVSSMASLGDELLIVGAFDTVDGQVGVNWARWRTCAADIDDGSGAGACDLAVTMDDLLAYLAWHAAGDPRADLTGPGADGLPDGRVDLDDLEYYVRAFERGC